MEDFIVRVHIIEVRNLLSGGETLDGGMADPMVEVTLRPQHHKAIRKRTQTYRRTASTLFDETFVFNLSLKKSQFLNGKVGIAVYDREIFTKNKLIGEMELGLAYVNKQPTHEVFRQWASLIDPHSPGVVKGYIRVSCAALGPGQSLPPHKDNEAEDEQEGEHDLIEVLGQYNQNISGYTLSLFVYKGENIRKMDTVGHADAYVRVFFNNNTLKTKVQKNTSDPVFNEELNLPIYKPSLSDRIIVELYDYDRLTSDELIATTHFSFEQVRLRQFGPQWVPLYGLAKKSLADKVLGNSSREEQYEYKGSLLLELRVKKEQTPRLGKMNANLKNPPARESYTLHIDLMQATELQAGLMSGVYVDIICSSVRYTTKTKLRIDHSYTWMESIPALDFSGPLDPQFLPDVFLVVYLRDVKGVTRVGHVRVTARQIWGFNGRPQWHLLEANKTSSAYEVNRIAGFLHFRAGLGPQAEAPPSRFPLKLEKKTKYQMRVHIYQAKNLPSSDATGSAHPFVIARLNGKYGKSTWKKRTLNPLWYETIKFMCEIPDSFDHAPQVHVLVKDHDWVTGNDLLGRFSVSTTKITTRMPAYPQWYQLYTDDDKVTEGAVLCSFQLVAAAVADKLPIVDIKPEMREYTLELSVLGLRAMKAVHGIDCQNLYVEFDLGGQKKKTKNSHKPSANGPNFNECLEFNVELAVNAELFSQTMTVRVYDTILGVDRVLGTAAIPLNDILRDNERRRRGLNTGTSMAKADDDGEAQELEDWEKYKCDDEINPEVAQLNYHESGRIMVTGKSDEQWIPAVQDVIVFDDDDSDEDLGDDSRDRFTQELEKVDGLDFPFKEYVVIRGKSRGINYVEARLKTRLSQGDARYPIGRLKLAPRLYQKGHEDESVIGKKVSLSKYESTQKYIVRAYILQGTNLSARDRSGWCDPYLIVSTNEDKDEYTINDRETWCFPKNFNPEFQKCYEVPAILPGMSELTINVMDRDFLGSVFGDDLIGTTVVDLENRLFSESWRAKNPRPIETRYLWHPKYKTQQGSLTMFVDILSESEARSIPQTPLITTSPEEFELRVVIHDVKNVDAAGRQMNMYVIGSVMDKCVKKLGGKPVQKTDCHFSSKSGKGVFNWRMKFPVLNPCKNMRLKLQIWDKDFLTQDDALSEANISLNGFFKRARKKRKSIKISKFYVSTEHPDKDGLQGDIRIELEMLPMSDALATPVGFGREEPNRNPYLPEPTRPPPPYRFDKLGSNFVKKHKGKIICALICVVIILLLIVIAYVAVQLNTFIQSIAPIISSFLTSLGL